jgi:GTP cyclohydrolase I
MEDVQSQNDHRNIALEKVGVKRLFYPITVLDRENGSQHTIAEVEMGVDLPHSFRGTHMSRFIEILNRFRGEITMNTMGPILGAMKKALCAKRAEMTLKFPYFMEKTAPVSGAKSLLNYDCRFYASFDGTEEDFVLTVVVPVTTLCPCSKAVSARSAHNQRSYVTVSVRFAEFIWIEEVIRMIEESGSAEIFSLLKRDDEKFLTEQAYENPRFAEDLVREIALKLEACPAIVWFAVETENQESIHAHSAYAFYKRDKRTNPA